MTKTETVIEKVSCSLKTIENISNTPILLDEWRRKTALQNVEEEEEEFHNAEAEPRCV